MSIRIKLIVTYLLMICFTLFVVLFLGMAMIIGGITRLGQTFIKDQTPEEAMTRSIDIMVDLRYTQRNEPEKLTDPNFIKSISSALVPFDGFVVVSENNDFTAYGMNTTDDELFQLLLISEETLKSSSHKDFDPNITWNNRDYLVIPYDIVELNTPLTYYLLIDTTSTKITSDKISNGLLLALLLFLTIILAPLFIITKKDILSPLKQLELGAKKIGEGDLNFHVNSPLKNEVGRVIHAFEKMRLELKHSIDTQLALEENRKELISNISHDLKTPITAIKGYVEGIRDGVADTPEKLTKYLDVIYAKSLSMDSMIDDLFLFSKLDLNKETFDMESVNIHTFFLHCQDEIQFDCQRSNVLCQFDNHIPDGVKVWMDSQKIKRVIQNIVGNAIKYNQSNQALIKILFSSDDKEVSIQITDNGPGMEPEQVEKIFDRFYRTDPSRNSKTGGTGLGLAIAKQIILQHHGIIKAESKKGQYTTLTFTLPLIQSIDGKEH